jgi:hypothetical protein
MDAVLLNNTKHYLITKNAEVIPLIPSTKNIDLPVIVNNKHKENVSVFSSVLENKKILCALKIISTAELFDQELYKSISEINLNNKDVISVHLSNFDAPIYFGSKNEIEKTVYLSKIFKHMNGNSITDYLKYVDLSYRDLVYLGFDDNFSIEKENI